MKIRHITLTGLFIALGILLPSCFHFFGIGRAFLPMHIPVLTAGLLMGGLSGLMAGMVTPLLSFFLTGMPPFPSVIAMVFELGTYGFTAGYFSKKLNIYLSVLLSMICSRIAFGIIYFFILPLFGVKVSLVYLLTGVFISSLPGIICQFALVPVFVRARNHYNKELEK